MISKKTRPISLVFLAFCLGLLLTACGGVVDPIFPTPLITPSMTSTAYTTTPRITDTPTLASSPTRQANGSPTTGPSPTSIIGATRTLPPEVHTATPRPNPNAPRIEFFTADIAYVYPGDSLTLFWSIRGADRATIYRLDDSGDRNQLWNVEPDGSLGVQTARNDRGDAEFLLTVDNGEYYVEELLSIPLLCAYPWFFAPEPRACADGFAEESTHIEQIFEGGRMIYTMADDRVYVLFADGQDPAWTSFPNRYIGGESAEEDTNFIPPPGRFQPIRILGTIWRASDIVRNRLALGLEPEVTYEGALQTDGGTAYIRSADGSILQLNPEGESWGIIAAP